MRKIAILNQKGGVGKTSTALNLGYGLAYTGRKVLIVDLDPQGHIALGLGLEKSDNVYELLRSNRPVRELIVKARDEVPLHIIPGSRRTADADREMVSVTFREKVLSKRLAEIEDEYDYIIFDCSPSFNIVNQNALTMASEVLVPISMDFFSAAGLLDIETSLLELERDLGIIRGVIPTFFDVRNKKTLTIIDYLKEKFGPKVTPPIRTNVKISDAQSQGQTIFEFDPGAAGASDYTDLVEWVVQYE